MMLFYIGLINLRHFIWRCEIISLSLQRIFGVMPDDVQELVVVVGDALPPFLCLHLSHSQIGIRLPAREAHNTKTPIQRGQIFLRCHFISPTIYFLSIILQLCHKRKKSQQSANKRLSRPSFYMCANR